MNIVSHLMDGCKKYGEYDFLVHLADDAKVVLSNVEIEKRSRQVAGGLKNIGVKRGDIVGVMVSNIPEIPELMCGVMRMGATFLPIIYMLTPNEICYILEDSKTEIVITEAKFWPKIKEALEGNTSVRKIIIIGDTGNVDKKIISYDEVRNQGHAADEIVNISSNELAILMYTSGSTGFPKGVMLSHENMILSAQSGMAVWPSPSEYPANFVSVPMNHIYGVSTLICAFLGGSYIILVPWFDPVKALDIITEYKVGILPLVPTMINMLLSKFNPEKHSFKSVQYFVSSGAPLAEETLVKAENKFGVKLLHAYGMTEAGPNITHQRLDHPSKIGSVGPPVPGIEVKIVDDDDKEVPRGEVGEIVIRGPSVTRGYWNKPRETAETIRNGWLHTGDLGRFDEDGEIFIVGRKKDLIIKGGENLDPAISENVLMKHPAVLEAATIAIPDSKYGEEVGSAVILKPEKSATAEELLEFVGKSMHHFAAPKRIFILDAFPRTGVGKILKREIKEIVKKLM